MKVVYYTHACCQVITEGGVRLLTDPWTFNPIGDSWQFPECDKPAEEYLDQDCLYISHNHLDHFDPLTLARFSRTIPVIIRAYEAAENPLKPTLVELGFQTIIEIEPGGSRRVMGDLDVTLYADLDTFDSALVMTDGVHTASHQNDCMISLEQARAIGGRHTIDLALLGLCSCSIFPTFFVMDQAEKLAALGPRKRRVMDRTAAFGEAVRARYVVPSAGDTFFVRRPDSDALVGPLPYEFKQESIERGRSFTVLTMNAGDVIDLAAPREDFAPRFADVGSFVAAIRAFRAKPEVQATLAALERWENGFAYDQAAFLAVFEPFCRHVSDVFPTLPALQLPPANQRLYRVRLALDDRERGPSGLMIEVDFAEGLMRAASAPYDLDTTGCDMVLQLVSKHMGQLAYGVYEFDEIRSGSMQIRRPGRFCKEEVGFWHVMTLFTSYLRRQGLERLDRRFPGQLSAVFGYALQQDRAA